MRQSHQGTPPNTNNFEGRETFETFLSETDNFKVRIANIQRYHIHPGTPNLGILTSKLYICIHK